MTDATSSPKHIRGRNIALWQWPLVALRLTALLGTLATCCLLYYLFAAFTARNPVPRWFLRAVSSIVGLRIVIRGIRPARRTFLLCNHVSWLDVPALAGVTGTAFIAHDGLASIKPLRWLCTLNDTVFVARHDRRSVTDQIRQVRAAIDEAGGLTIFPEGTTSDGRALLPFKSSLLSALEAAADHVPIQPVWLDYAPETEAIAWVGSEPGLDNALRILARWRPINLAITFLPPLKAADRIDRKAISRSAYKAISAAVTGRFEITA